METLKITNDWTLTFGKHKGVRIGDVPARYLLALLNNPDKLKDTNRMLFNYIHKDQQNIIIRGKIEARNYFRNR